MDFFEAAKTAKEALEDKKAENVKILSLSGLSSVADVRRENGDLYDDNLFSSAYDLLFCIMAFLLYDIDYHQ